MKYSHFCNKFHKVFLERNKINLTVTSVYDLPCKIKILIRATKLCQVPVKELHLTAHLKHTLLTKFTVAELWSNCDNNTFTEPPDFQIKNHLI